MAKKADLRKPDPFLDFTLKLWDGIADHAKQIGIVLLLAVVAALVAVGVTVHNASLREKAGADLSQALAIAIRPVASDEAEKPATPPPADQAPFKTSQEKNTALAAALTQVRSNHSGTEAATAALLPLADAQLALGQLDAAAESYSGFASASPFSDPLHALAVLGLARTAEAKKDLAAAAQAYDRLQSEAPHSFLKDVAAFGKARILEASGKKAEAAAAYQAVVEGFQGTEASKDASGRLALLAGEGIVPPTPLPAHGADGGAARSLE